jgi:hypothetical protein
MDNIIILRKRMKKTFSIIFIVHIVLIIACSESITKTPQVPTFNLVQELKNKTDVPISKYIDSLEYVPLELTSESAIVEIRKIYLTDGYIIIDHSANFPSNRLMLFDRHTGKFIRFLGKRGEGPEEYRAPVKNFFNPYDNFIYTYGTDHSSIKRYNLNGEFIESFTTPPNRGSTERVLPVDAFLSSNTFLGYLDNKSGQDSQRIVIFTRDRIIKSFPHYEKWVNNSIDQYVELAQNPVITSWDNDISFKERSNDTVFLVTLDKLIPRFILSTGVFKYPYRFSLKEAYNGFENQLDYFSINNMFENSRYVFFDLFNGEERDASDPNMFHQIHNFLILDKLTLKLTVCNNYENYSSYLIDDINGFLPMIPFSITEHDELLSVVYPQAVIRWRQKNPVLKDQLLIKYPWINQISEVDNPILLIGKLKTH